jgi:nucleoid DNA-binding protein
MTKTEFLDNLANRLIISRKDAKGIMTEIKSIIVSQLGKKGPGQVVIPELDLKLVVVSKPATKAHPGKNPFTGEDIIVKAKPASKVVKARVMKGLNSSI